MSQTALRRRYPSLLRVCPPVVGVGLGIMYAPHTKRKCGLASELMMMSAPYTTSYLLPGLA